MRPRHSVTRRSPKRSGRSSPRIASRPRTRPTFGRMAATACAKTAAGPSARSGSKRCRRRPAASPARQPGSRRTALRISIVPRMTMIGAGSAVFALQVITDVLAIDGLDQGVFALVDIDPTRRELAREIAERLVDRSGKRWTVEASTDRREVLPGTNYVVNSIEVAGLQNVRHDYDIPKKDGVDQCIGDTIGPGGIFKALRTGPAWLDILHDAEELCPHAWVLNYTNPMSILTLAALKGTAMPTVGLCHSVQGTSRQLAGYLEVPYAELEWRCAGINHNAWFTELRYHGQDMYPRLRERARVPEVYEHD